MSHVRRIDRDRAGYPERLSDLHDPPQRVILTRQGKDWKVDGYWMFPSDADGTIKKT